MSRFTSTLDSDENKITKQYLKRRLEEQKPRKHKRAGERQRI